MNAFLKSYRPALQFLLTFLGIYLLLNTVYGLYINAYYPKPDPVTVFITEQVVTLLSLFYSEISYLLIPDTAYVTVQKEGFEVINVFEGCNGLNVMIVYVAFLFAFSGRIRDTWVFTLVGLALVYVANLGRVFLLFQVSLHFPDQLYFFHKYFFTSILYLIVFALWFLWIKRVKSQQAKKDEAY